MKPDENGVGLYEQADVDNSTGWANLLNAGQQSMSDALTLPMASLRDGAILTARSTAEQTQLLDAHRKAYGLKADDNNPQMVFRYDLDMLMACGTTWKRVAGHAMFHHRLLTRNGNVKVYSQNKRNLGRLPFVLHADTEVVFGLSCLVLPTGWASGYFSCVPNGGAEIQPWGYWTSQQTNHRISYYREWAAQLKRGTNYVDFKYEHTKDSPETVIGTVWAFVRYASA